VHARDGSTLEKAAWVLSVVGIAAWVPACRTQPTDRTPLTAIAITTGEATAADGLPIAYDLRGAGSPALVFIHGWACDRTYWREQLDAFAGEHRVVAIDLGGHGSSGKERDDWSLTRLAGDVRDVVEELDLDAVVLIGHSMGGPVALEAAPLLAPRVWGVVGVDTLHDAEMRFPEDLANRILDMLEADFDGMWERSAEWMFSSQPDPALVDWFLAKRDTVDRAAVIAVARAMYRHDVAASFHGAGVPIRCINARARPPVGLPTETERNQTHADYDAVILDGVGHLLMMEDPERFNATLRKVLAGLTAP